jgi:PPOX class probable F420-dependent enzyme
MQIDTSSEFGARVQRRLSEEKVIWLITTDRNGTPQPSPVWFLWNGQTLLIYSQPDTPKLRNIQRSPRVALHFDTDGRGEDIVVLTGEARVAEQMPPADRVPEYVRKYADDIPAIGQSPESLAREYSVPIEVTPTGLRGF